MASLASTWLAYNKIAPRKNLISYTFGMPRVGNYDYALQHDRLVNDSWRVVNDDDLVPHFPSLVSLSVLNGPYHHGVEAFYSETATSVYSKHRECNGKPYNEDATCSFSEVTRSIARHKEYFSIPVGTFWETKCVSLARNRRSASEKSRGSKFQFLKGQCSVYKYDSGSYVKAASSSASLTMLSTSFDVLLFPIAMAFLLTE